jgi:hypothetical protein
MRNGFPSLLWNAPRSSISSWRGFSTALKMLKVKQIIWIIMKDIEGTYQHVVVVEEHFYHYHICYHYPLWYLTITSTNRIMAHHLTEWAVRDVDQIVYCFIFYLEVGSAAASTPIVFPLSSSFLSTDVISRGHKQCTSPVILERPSRSVGCVEGVFAETFCWEWCSDPTKQVSETPSHVIFNYGPFHHPWRVTEWIRLELKSEKVTKCVGLLL